MNNGIYTAFSGMQAQLDALDLIANNLANINTTGFKEETPFFTMLNQSMGLSKPSGELTAATSHSVRTNGALNASEGSMSMTNRDLDVAIEGNGFLVIQTPRGIRYTRNGNLHLNAQCILTTADGSPVLGNKMQPILLGPAKIHIGSDGSIFLQEADGDRLVDRLKVVTFDQLSLLEREGDSLFVHKDGQQTEKPSDASIRAGYLEQSNVDPVSSVVQLVEIMRQFESLQKCVHLVMNEMNSKSIDKLGR